MYKIYYSDFSLEVAKVSPSKRGKEIMKKRSKIVVGASIVCLCIAMAIQVVFGGGMGLGIDPKEIEVAQGSTITYGITVYNYQDTPDSFDVFVLPGSCDSGWFSWTTNQITSVPADRGQKVVLLDVTPTKSGNYKFTVRAVSKSDKGIQASQTASISVKEDKKPDLIITNIWNVGTVVHYEIKNIGNGRAPKCSYTTLYVDGVSKSEDHVSIPLEPGGSKEGQFNDYTCKQNDKIKVCADNNNVIEELDESNNCMLFDCPCGGQPCIALTPGKSEPQYFGTVINWTACACDPEVEGCKLCYRFWLEGPGTGWVKTKMQDWSTNSTWRLITIKDDIGDSNIYVDAGDCDHLNVFQTAVYRDYTITGTNYPPVCACLMPDKSEPQHYGMEITWNASAFDREGDPLEYRFLLSGPGTGHKFVVMQGWRTAHYPDYKDCPTWTWTPGFNDMGSNDIKVEIRDGQYVPYPDYYDVSATYYDYWIGPAE